MSAIVFNTNTLSKVATRSVNQNTSALARSTEKLSSGTRINRAGDDVTGLSVSAKLDSKIRGFRQAERNIMDGVAFID